MLYKNILRLEISMIGRGEAGDNIMMKALMR
jgi:hypothetical protein